MVFNHNPMWLTGPTRQLFSSSTPQTQIPTWQPFSSSTPQTQTPPLHPRLPSAAPHFVVLPRYVLRQHFLPPHPNLPFLLLLPTSASSSSSSSSWCHFTPVVISITLLSVALIFALSTQQRLKLYKKVPPNGMVLYTNPIVTEDGKEKKVTFDFEPFRPINAFLYLCDNKFNTESLNKLLESDNKFGFIVMDGNVTLFGTLNGNTREVLHQQLRQVHHVGRPNEIQFLAGFADENMVIAVALEQVDPTGIELLQVKDMGKKGEGDDMCLWESPVKSTREPSKRLEALEGPTLWKPYEATRAEESWYQEEDVLFQTMRWKRKKQERSIEEEIEEDEIKSETEGK